MVDPGDLPPTERVTRTETIAMTFRAKPAGLAVLVGLFVLAGILHLLAAAGATAGATTFTDRLLAPIPVVGNFLAVLAGLSILLVVVAIADFVIAWALWKVKSWAWTAALVFSIVELFVVPWGTILGILRFVYLAMGDVRAAFEEEREARPGVAAPGRPY